MTSISPPSTNVPATAVAVSPVTFGRLLAAEWVKLRSLRSTWALLALAVVLVPAMAMARFSSISAVPEAVGSDTLVASVYLTSGVVLAQLAVVALGVICITGEYGTGQIRTTLLAAPDRLTVWSAKLLVVVAAVMAAALVAVLLAWAASAPWFERTGTSVDPTRAEDLRLLLGMPLYLGAVAALAYGVGTILRSSASGIAIVLGIVLVVENGLGAIPWAPIQNLAAHLPASAGGRLLQSEAVGSVTSTASSASLSPWGGYAIMLAWVGATLVVAGVLLRRRDS